MIQYIATDDEQMVVLQIWHSKNMCILQPGELLFQGLKIKRPLVLY